MAKKLNSQKGIATYLGEKGNRIEFPLGAIETKAAELVNAKVIEGIRAIRNESARGVNRLVFDLKKDAPGLVILNNVISDLILVEGVDRGFSVASFAKHIRAAVAASSMAGPDP